MYYMKKYIGYFLALVMTFAIPFAQVSASAFEDSLDALDSVYSGVGYEFGEDEMELLNDLLPPMVSYYAKQLAKEIPDVDFVIPAIPAPWQAPVLTNPTIDEVREHYNLTTLDLEKDTSYCPDNSTIEFPGVYVSQSHGSYTQGMVILEPLCGIEREGAEDAADIDIYFTKLVDIYFHILPHLDELYTDASFMETLEDSMDTYSGSIGLFERGTAYDDSYYYNVVECEDGLEYNWYTETCVEKGSWCENGSVDEYGFCNCGDDEFYSWSTEMCEEDVTCNYDYEYYDWETNSCILTPTCLDGYYFDTWSYSCEVDPYYYDATADDAVECDSGWYYNSYWQECNEGWKVYSDDPVTMSDYTGDLSYRYNEEYRTIYTQRPTQTPVSYMIKGDTDPKAYMLDYDGVLHWIENEETARYMYGDDWDSRIIWLEESLIYTYEIGDSVNEDNYWAY